MTESIELAGVVFSNEHGQVWIRDNVMDSLTSVMEEDLGKLIRFLQSVDGDYLNRLAMEEDAARLKGWNMAMLEGVTP